MRGNKFKVFYVSVKRMFLPAVFVLFTLCLLLFSRTNIQAAKNGLSLWATSVVPSLFPFFIATELLGYTGIVRGLGKLFNGIMRPVFNVPGEGAFAVIMGVISGYPTGAKIVKNFREDGICTKEEAERLLAFTNNSGPLFIIGSLGLSMLGDLQTGYLLLLTHFLSAISVGILFRFWKYNSNNDSKKNRIRHSTLKGSKSPYNDSSEIGFASLGEVLQNSILSATSTIMMIGGFVVLFSVVLSILNNSGVLNVFSFLIKPVFDLFGIPFEYASGFASGIIELTNGLKAVSSVHTKSFSYRVIIAAFLLGFGGISVCLQVFSIISSTDISIKPYIIGKFIQGLFASFYTFIALKNFKFLRLDIDFEFGNEFGFYLLIFLILLVGFFVFNFRFKKKKVLDF